MPENIIDPMVPIDTHPLRRVFIILFLVIIYLLLFFAGLYLSYLNYIPAQLISSLSTPYKPTQNNDGTFAVNIDLNNPSLREVAIIYEFNTRVKELRESPDGTEILTDLNNSKIPKFVNSSNTAIYFGRSPFETYGKAQLSDIKPGDRVKLVSLYFFKRNFWRLGYIFIPPSDAQIQTSPRPI